jgi:hypothetical protein
MEAGDFSAQLYGSAAVNEHIPSPAALLIFGFSTLSLSYG